MTQLTLKRRMDPDAMPKDTLERLMREYAAADKALYDYGAEHGAFSILNTDRGHALYLSLQNLADQIEGYVVAEMLRLGTCVGWEPNRRSVHAVHHQKQPDGSFGVVFSPMLEADRSSRSRARAMFPNVHVRIPNTAAIPAAIDFFNSMVAREAEMQRATRAALSEYNRKAGNTNPTTKEPTT